MNLRHTFTPHNNTRLTNLCGPADAHLRTIEEALQVKIAHRHEQFKVDGPKAKATQAMELLQALYELADRPITEDYLQLMLAGDTALVEAPDGRVVATTDVLVENRDFLREWSTAQDAAHDLFAAPATGAGLVLPPAATGGPPVRVPESFVQLCEQRLVLHRDPARFALMYRLLWRLSHDHALRRDPLDADRMQARHMAHAVARDMHKMHAFVRFRPVTDSDGGTLHVAWFEPGHFIAEATAGFFVRRFAQMRWAILTPDASIRWDGSALHTGPGAQRSDAPPPDAGEALWLTYYRHIFNPARLKTTMMQKEMPRRYWPNLPEAALITELAHGAHERSGRMVQAEATTPRRRLGAPSGPPRTRAGGAAALLPPSEP